MPRIDPPLSVFRIARRTILSALVLLLARSGSGSGESPLAEISAPLSFRVFKVEEGLAGNTVRAIVQDPVGLLWFGTEQGLDRFDGHEFTPFAKETGRDQLPAAEVGSLVVDRDGFLWIGTWGRGLHRLNVRSWECDHLRHDPRDPASLPDDRIELTWIDSEGGIWIGTFNGGAARLDPKTKEIRRLPGAAGKIPELDHGRVRAFAETPDGGIWIGTNGGLFRLDRKTNAVERPEIRLPNRSIRALACDARGTLWVGTEGGLARLGRNGASVDGLAGDSAPLLGRTTVNSILADSRGAVWIGTMQDGLFSVNSETWAIERYVHDPGRRGSLGHDDIRTLYEDRSGVLWIGTLGGGLSALDLKPRKFLHVSETPGREGGLGSPTVLSLLEDSTETLWVGTAKGLDELDSAAGRFRHHPAVPGDPAFLQNESIQALLEDSSGFVWVGTWRGGLSRYDRKSGKFEHFRAKPGDSSSLSDDHVKVLLEDRERRLWVGTAYGLDLLDRAAGTFRQFLPEPGKGGSLADGFVTALLEDRSGKLWVGTDVGGLSRLDPTTGAFETFRSREGDPSSLPNDRIRGLAEDGAGGLWIGTANGLARLDPDGRSFRRLGEREGLPSSNVQSLLRDGAGSIWIGMMHGLARLDPANGRIRTYTMSDGLQGEVFNPGAAARAPSGRIYFGGTDGFNVFLPADAHDDPTPPPVVLRSFRHGDRPLLFDRPLSSIAEVRLPWRESSFTVAFAALDTTDPEANLYSFRLEGFDQEWSRPAADRAARYTRIPPGKYTFRVRASNSDGVWNETGAGVGIVIPPPFWQTLWFRLAALLALLGAAHAAHRMRLRSLRVQKETLERLVAERTAELAHKRDQLERINEIVMCINTEISFSDLLTSLLEHMAILRGVERAAALIWDHETNAFRFKAASGWSVEELSSIGLTREEAEARYVTGAAEIYQDVFVVKDLASRPGDDRIAGLERAKSMLVMRVKVGGKVEGYLVFDSMSDENAFDEQDSLFLENLREHIISAFLKTRMLQELKILNEKKNEFVGIAAHDLRGPIGLIMGWTSITLKHLQSGKFTPERGVRDLGKVLGAAEEMNHLISELLDVSAIESGKIDIDRKREDLRSIFEEREPLYGRLASEKNISLRIDDAVELPPVLVDRAHILEVIDNLLSNAIKYTSPGGSVRVSFEAVGKEVATHVADTGQGLTPDDLKAMFRSYGKLSARPTGGESSTGLGLAIVKKIVDLHDGRVTVESEKGKGSTFTFTLPIAAA
jgi:ligand-binding sensor domain-containing protein/signal transduction histidine kinase